eukprot:6201539-Pleurochrysis_carterae.AAC.4
MSALAGSAAAAAAVAAVASVAASGAAAPAESGRTEHRAGNGWKHVGSTCSPKRPLFALGCSTT